MSRLKYCLLIEGIDPATQFGSCISAWADAFHGDIKNKEEILARDTINNYDLIHVRFCKKNINLVSKLKAHIDKQQAKTKMMLSIDILASDFHTEFTKDDIDYLIKASDLAFVCDYSVAKIIKNTTNIKLYILPHPYKKDHQHTNLKKKQRITVIGNEQDFLNPLNIDKVSYERQLALVRCKYKFEFCFFSEENVKEIFESLKLSQYLINLSIKENYGPAHINASSLGVISFGFIVNSAISQCSHYGHVDNVLEMLNRICWLEEDNLSKNNAISHALWRSHKYSAENNYICIRNRLLENKIIDGDLSSLSLKKYSTKNALCFDDHIHKISGIEHVPYNIDEVVLISVAKNVANYLPSFLRHYRNLGVKHFYIIDNMSNDRTVDMLKNEGDVTLYQTDLEHYKYENEIKSSIIEKHCYQRWFFCVDIDELFVYPYSEEIKLKDFLCYLTENNFTSVYTYMLDMLAGSDRVKNNYIEPQYPYFNIQNISKKPYFNEVDSFYCRNNELSDTSMQAYFGGPRQLVLSPEKSEFLLVKHSLMYRDNHLDPVTTPHCCNNSRVADITSFVKHYKLMSFDDRSESSHQHSFAIKDLFESYRNGVQEISKKIGTLTEYRNSQQLVDLDFIKTSKRYRAYIKNLVVNAPM